MADLAEVVVVTAAAVLALGVLLRPLVPRRSAPTALPKKTSCSACQETGKAEG